MFFSSVSVDGFCLLSGFFNWTSIFFFFFGGGGGVWWDVFSMFFFLLLFFLVFFRSWGLLVEMFVFLSCHGHGWL